MEKHYIIGIGSSAGGLEALQKLVACLKPEWPLSFIIAQHLSPSHNSILTELLRRTTSLAICELHDGQIPEIGHIYVIPPNTDVIYKKGKLSLLPPEYLVAPKPSVDRLLISLAKELGDKAIGIILSGTGGDGSKGLREIKSEGGLAIVQDPDSAKFTGMLNAALQDHRVDYVVPPEEMGAVLEAYVTGGLYETIPTDGEQSELIGVVRAVYDQTGLDLSGYKTSTVMRRLERRMQVVGVSTIPAYEEILAQKSDEASKFAHEVLISVTEFFRDRKAFIALEDVFYELVESISTSREIRIWNPGCATGEETYSLAILLEEAIRKHGGPIRYKIFASDIDGRAIAIGRQGSYLYSACEALDETWRERYFDRDGDYLIATKALRNNIVFSVHNLVQDPPFSRIDLVSCRNLLIYFTNVLQKRVLNLFNYSLNNDGLLFLGHSESIETHKDLFANVNRDARIFRKQPNFNAPYRALKGLEMSGRMLADRTMPIAKQPLSLERRVQQFVVEEYAPAGIAISQQDEVVYILGNIEPYIMMRTGPVAQNLFGLLRSELRSEARALIYKYRRERQTLYGVKHVVEVLGQSREIRLTVRSLPMGKDLEIGEVLLVLFEIAELNGQTHKQNQVPDGAFSNQEHAEELELELRTTQEHLQNVIQELETSNEELQSITEELQSANEELQSTNEELQTSNEELQSTNEELLTVNDEMEVKSRELEITLTDLQNIVNSTEYPLLVIDKNLRITRYVPAIEQLIEKNSIRNGDIISTVSWKVEIRDLKAILQKVIETGNSYYESLEYAGRHYRFIVKPYQSANLQTAGAVLWFPEFTDLAVAHAQVSLSRSQLSALVDSVMVGIILINHQGIIQRINNAAARMFGYDNEELLGQSVTVLMPAHHANEHHNYVKRYLRTGQKNIIGNIRELEGRHKEGSFFPIELTVNEVTGGSHRSFCGVINDISKRKEAENKLAEEQLRALVTLESISDAVITVDSGRFIKYMNPVAERLTGYNLATAIGKNLTDVFKIYEEKSHYSLDEQLLGQLDNSNQGLALLDNALLKNKDELEFSIEFSLAPLIDKMGKALGSVLSFNDVTNKRVLLQQMIWQAQHDPLTGLVNRTEFERRAQQALDSASSFNRHHAMLYLDLDQFKIVNDTCGHHAGDELLRQVASIFGGNLRHRDTLARMGGDEFAVLLENSSLEQAEKIAVKLTELAQDFRFSCDGKLFKIGASIGVVPMTNETKDLASLLSDADAACYAAKEAGRNRIQVHSPDDADLQGKRRQMHWVSRINHAIDDNRLQLYFQKIKNLNGDNNAEHWEVLLRLIDEQGDIVPPGAFLPSAERYGLMLNIDQWVLKRLVTELIKYASVPQVSVNLSGTSLVDARFFDYASKLISSNISVANKICFEITETAAVTNFVAAQGFIRAMKRLGCLFALDDFGSGMSSFGYLKNLPVDYLKIDGVFVRDILDDQIDLFMVESINRIGQLMKMQTIAEFAENDQIVQKLSEVGVNFAQGYAIGFPITLEQFIVEARLVNKHQNNSKVS
ncbi:MAG: EAL domain-containing protein [Methylococcaceae bacterium]|jgi:two-component system CheB/CheR fusion protein